MQQGKQAAGEEMLDKENRGDGETITMRTNAGLELKLKFEHDDFAKNGVKSAISKFADLLSKPRQLLFKRYEARNVRVTKATDDEIILEIIPHNREGLLTLIIDYSAGSLHQALINSLDYSSKSDSVTVTFDCLRAKELRRKLLENKCEYLPVGYAASSEACQLEARVAKKIIEDERSYLYDFIIKVLRTDSNWKSVKNELGQNILHMCVISSRHDLLPAIFYAGAWDDLRSELARADQNEADDVLYTPFALAEKYHSRSNGMKTLYEMHRLDDLWLSIPLLHEACILGVLHYVRQFLPIIGRKHSIDINVRDDAGNTQLLYACAAGHKDIIDYLLKYGADPNISNDVGENALICAVYRDSDIVRMILEAGMNDVEYRDKNGLRAIDHAVMTGDTDMVDTLHDNGIFPDDVTVTFAAKYGRLLMLEHLLGKYKLSTNGRDSEGRTPLLNAVALGSAKMVNILLSNGACLSASDNRNRNVFHIAALNNHVDVAKLLISKISINFFEYNHYMNITPIQSLPDVDSNAKNEEILCVQDLLNAQDYHSGREEGMVVRGRDRGRPAWHYIHLWRTRKTIFNACFRKGQVDVKLYSTVMGSGFSFGPSKEFIAMRQKEFSERQKECIDDLTPLAIAVLNDHYDVATLFLDSGADVNRRDRFACTPLHYACMTGNLPLVKALIQNGARLDVVDNENLSLADVAQINGHKHMVNFLKESQQATVIREFLEKAKVEMERPILNNVISNEGSLRRHLTNTLRDLQININQSLVDLGSGPVMQVTSDN